MENNETRGDIQTAARKTTESARKVGDKLRAFAGAAADLSRRWAARGGEAISRGARLTTLQANQRVLRARLDRAYRELGRAAYAAHEKGEEAGHPPEPPERQAALQQVKDAEAALDANLAELVSLRKTETRGDSTSR